MYLFPTDSHAVGYNLPPLPGLSEETTVCEIRRNAHGEETVHRGYPPRRFAPWRSHEPQKRKTT